MNRNWYVICNGHRYQGAEIEKMSVAEIEEISLDVSTQQLATTAKITAAKAALLSGNPITDDEFLRLRLKMNILNTVQQRLALIKKRKNIGASESRDRLIIKKLREIVGYDAFIRVVGLVEDEIKGRGETA